MTISTTLVVSGLVFKTSEDKTMIAVYKSAIVGLPKTVTPVVDSRYALRYTIAILQRKAAEEKKTAAKQEEKGR